MPEGRSEHLRARATRFRFVGQSLHVPRKRDGEWRNDRQEWGTFRDRVEEVGAAALDADVIGRFFDLYRFDCAASVRFDWDPHGWARCYIKCDHGEWYRDSHLLNVTEAFVLARREWAAGSEHADVEEV